MSSRWVASLVALACWLLSQHVLGQSVVIRCNVRGDDVAVETATRLRGELLAMGVDVAAPRVVARKERPVPEVAPNLFRDADAVMDVSATSEQLVIELWARDGINAFARWMTVTQPRRASDAPEKLALRAAEALHSRFVEADLLPARPAAVDEDQSSRAAKTESSHPASDAVAPSAARTNGSATDAQSPRGDSSPIEAPGRRPRPSGPPGVAQDAAPAHTTAPRDIAATRDIAAPDDVAVVPWSSLQRPSISIGGAVMGATDGLTPAVLPFARLTWPLGDAFAPYLTVAALGSSGRATTSGGEARVSFSYGVIGASYFYDGIGFVMPYVSAGVGATYVSVDGRAVAPYEAHTQTRWLGTAELGMGALFPLSARYYATLGGQLHLTAPSLAIVVVDDTVAISGRPNWAGTLAIGVRL